jgi:hypothetical protein
MKKLFYIPMIHSPEALTANGRASHSNYDTTQFWQIVDQAVKEKQLDQPVVYAEGSTKRREIAPGELEAVDTSMPEQRIVKALLESGGVIEETEDPELIAEAERAYKKLDEVVRQSANDPSLSFLTDDERTLISGIHEISDMRSAAVAERIARTLPEDRVGVLLLGGNHDVLGKLPKDIQVEPLDPRLDEMVTEFQREINRDSETTKDFSGGGETKG